MGDMQTEICNVWAWRIGTLGSIPYMIQVYQYRLYSKQYSKTFDSVLVQVINTSCLFHLSSNSE